MPPKEGQWQTQTGDNEYWKPTPFQDFSNFTDRRGGNMYRDRCVHTGGKNRSLNESGFTHI